MAASWSFAVDISLNTSVNWMDRDGNIMFHFNPRRHEGQIVMNTYRSHWGREERIGLDISDTVTRADIKVTQSCYEISINGELKHRYNHRLPWYSFDHISEIPLSWELLSASVPSG